MIPLDPTSGTYRPCAAGSVSVPAPATRPRPNTQAATLSSFSSSGYAGEGGAPTGDSSRPALSGRSICAGAPNVSCTWRVTAPTSSLRPRLPARSRLMAYKAAVRRCFRLGAHPQREPADEQRDREHDHEGEQIADIRHGEREPRRHEEKVE